MQVKLSLTLTVTAQVHWQIESNWYAVHLSLIIKLWPQAHVPIEPVCPLGKCQPQPPRQELRVVQHRFYMFLKLIQWGLLMDLLPKMFHPNFILLHSLFNIRYHCLFGVSGRCWSIETTCKNLLACNDGWPTLGPNANEMGWVSMSYV